MDKMMQSPDGDVTISEFFPIGQEQWGECVFGATAGPFLGLPARARPSMCMC